MCEYLRDLNELEVQINSKRVQQTHTMYFPASCFCIFLLYLDFAFVIAISCSMLSKIQCPVLAYYSLNQSNGETNIILF